MQVFTKIHEVHLSDVNIKTIADVIIHKWQEHICLDHRTLPTLSELKKTKTLGLITNFDHPPHVRKLLSEYGLDLFFDVIVISEDVGVTKANPNIFYDAFTKTGVLASETVYVGDTEEDVAAARAAKVRPILIRRNGVATDRRTLDYSDCASESTPKERPEELRDVATISSLDELLTEYGGICV